MTKQEALELSRKFIYAYDKSNNFKLEYGMMLSIMQDCLIADIQPEMYLARKGKNKMKKYHKDSWEYKRLMEILDAYWLTEPNEDFVRIDLYFRKGEEEQRKTLMWVNPNGKEK